MTPVDRARADYAMWMAVSAIHRAHDPKPCGLCGAIGLQLDAASIASDMAVARHWSGTHPRLMSREFPIG